MAQWAIVQRTATIRLWPAKPLASVRLAIRYRARLDVKNTIVAVWHQSVQLGFQLGSNIRLFNVIDDYNREGLGIEVDFSLTFERVIRSLERVIEWHGKPRVVRCDNGPK